ncbi:unnamed protein product [Lactuca virosa]|uniref:Uncharacterized protein n=1 Tax=Lactuca virosa TaxID=75947 RepID=A0AAU9M1T5_9ASTR|nr:unnamed protein product [Lactuca virosa]
MEFGDVPRGKTILYSHADRIATNEVVEKKNTIILALMSSNNQCVCGMPVVVVANKTEIMEPFYIRYVNLTLNHVESPPRKQSPPPIVTSPPRRKKYKSETSSTETTTSASTSHQPQVKKTSYVKRHINQKKDKPHIGFSGGEDMVNEDEEETHYHGTGMNYDDTFMHGLEGEFGPTTMGKYVEPLPDVVQHHKKQSLLLLGSNEQRVFHGISGRRTQWY